MNIEYNIYLFTNEISITNKKPMSKMINEIPTYYATDIFFLCKLKHICQRSISKSIL